MSASYLLDTNICIYIRLERPPPVLHRFGELGQGQAAISVVTLGELIYGVERSSDPETSLKKLEQLCERLPVLPVPREAGATYGSIRAILQRAGTVIGANDLWIAAHALAAGLILVTNNEREFRRVPGLKVENWARPA